jgi:ABC-2 type transport system permease protein
MSRDSLTGTWALLRLALRQDWLRIVVWTVSLVGLMASSVPALDRMYPDAASREARAAIMRTPTGVIAGGPGYGLEHYTLGPMVANEMTTTLVVSLIIMNILTVVRRTRAEEEAGRTELLAALPVGRRAQSAAALVLLAGENVLIGGLIALVLVGNGLTVPDSIVYGLGMALAGLLFASVAAVCAQLTEHGRTASGMAIAVFAALFMCRVAGDLSRVGGTWLSWLSPTSWMLQTRMYVDLRWWPLALYPVAIVVLVAVASALEARRDVGAGLVRPRAGRARAGAALRGVLSLQLRLLRGRLAVWIGGTAVVGLAFGSLVKQAANMIQDNPKLLPILGGDAGRLVDGFVSMAVLYVAMMATATGMIVIGQLRSEEAAGRAEDVLAAAVSRRRWLGSALGVALVAAVAAAALGGLAFGVTAASSTGDASLLGRSLDGVWNTLPVPLVFVALAALAYAVAPRLGWLVWAYFAFGLLCAMLGRLLGLADWVMDLSPFGWPAAVPLEGFEAAPVWWMAAGVVVSSALALIGFRRRNVPIA